MTETRTPSAAPRNAGRDLDAEVAEKVMGLVRASNGDGVPLNYLVSGEPIPAFSTDIASAWQVVKRVQEICGAFAMMELLVSDHAKCTIHDLRSRDKIVDWHIAEADTAPLAICLAALRAVGTPEEEETRARVEAQGDNA